MIPTERPVDDSAMAPIPRRVFIGGALASAAAAGACAPSSSPSSTAPTTSETTSGSAQSPSATSTAAPAVSHDDLVHGPRTARAVALTFHGAGAPELTRAALSIAHRQGARFTVMAVGRWLDQNPALAREILDGGHELGNHTWSHQTMPRLDAATTRTEIVQAADVLERLTGTHGRWFRPSGTPHSTPLIRAAALAAGYRRCLSYDVDSLDYTDPGAAAVRAKVRRETRGGSIVSLHLGHPGTIQALPAILSDLTKHGLAAVTVSELVGGAA